MRAFIFSLDAFVAFTLALVAIYSLIFFSSIPSAYYYLLTQGHYLSRDALLSLSTATCSADYGVCASPGGSVLDNIVAQADPGNRQALVQSTVGAMIPVQFGYVLEMSQDEGSTWGVVYDTASDSSDPHAKLSKKLTVTTQVITFGYSGRLRKFSSSPYNYLSCSGDGYNDGPGVSGGGSSGGVPGATGGDDFGTITCGTFNTSGGGSSGTGGSTGGNMTVPLVNTYPGNVLGGDIVPSSDVRLVRLTVYI
jgi:hypothetical protein